VRLATVIGMGLQIALAGLESVGAIVKNERTIMGLGDITDYHLWLTLVGLVVMGSLMQKQYSAAILITMLALTLLTWVIDSSYPKAIFSVPERTMQTSDFLNFGTISISGLISPVMTFLVVGLVDVGGCILGLGAIAGLIEEKKTDGDGPVRSTKAHGKVGVEGGELDGSKGQLEDSKNDDRHADDGKHLEEESAMVEEGELNSSISLPGTVFAFIGCGIGTVVGSCFGGTPTIVVVESAVGIKVGARTGLAACVVGCWFSLALFLTPFLSHIPNVATAPVSVLLGVMMMSQALLIDWNCLQDAIPAFLTATMIPFTFSVADGIIMGMLAAIMLGILNGDAYKYASQFYVKWILRDASYEFLSYRNLLQRYNRSIRRKDGKNTEFVNIYENHPHEPVDDDLEALPQPRGLVNVSYALFENHPRPPASQAIAEMQFQNAMGNVSLDLDLSHSSKRSWHGSGHGTPTLEASSPHSTVTPAMAVNALLSGDEEESKFN
jgi:xanthine/uracil/vitamin C permease (AzgA family)